MVNQPFFIPAVLIAIIAIPLVFGLIPRNRLYGIRTPKTLSSDRVWYPSNRFGGWLLIFSSIFYLILAKIYPTTGPKDPNFSLWLLHLGAFVLPLIVGTILTLKYTKRL